MYRTPTPTKIIRIVDEARELKTFYLLNKKISEDSKPGNFVLVWVPFPADNHIERAASLDSLDQIPMSISFADPSKGIFGITVKEVGPTTSELHRYQKNMYLGIIGPLGNSFSRKGDICILVGGGIGVAPLHYLAMSLASAGKKLFGFMGFRTKEEMFFVEQMRRLFQDLVITTEDGSYGMKSLITEPFQKFLEKHKNQLSQGNSHALVYCCGPELMMKRVLTICEDYGFPAEFSLERHIHCGIGICGFCSINGYRVCKEGPIFSSEQLKNIRDFGVFTRKNSGKRVVV